MHSVAISIIYKCFIDCAVLDVPNNSVAKLSVPTDGIKRNREIDLRDQEIDPFMIIKVVLSSEGNKTGFHHRLVPDFLRSRKRNNL
jgi:hypothetical protein